MSVYPSLRIRAGIDRTEDRSATLPLIADDTTHLAFSSLNLVYENDGILCLYTHFLVLWLMN